MIDEYEPHLEQRTVVYTGVDYAAILHVDTGYVDAELIVTCRIVH
jgi:hypothetical protein